MWFDMMQTRIDAEELDRVRELIQGPPTQGCRVSYPTRGEGGGWCVGLSQTTRIIDYETRQERQSTAVRELAQELTQEPETLKRLS